MIDGGLSWFIYSSVGKQVEAAEDDKTMVKRLQHWLIDCMFSNVMARDSNTLAIMDSYG